MCSWLSAVPDILDWGERAMSYKILGVDDYGMGASFAAIPYPSLVG